MYCTQCGVEIGNEDRFCSRCGVRTGVGQAVAQAYAVHKTLMLDKRNKKVAGVCAGFARYFECDIILVRVVWLAVALVTGIGFIAYAAAWMVMPSDRGMEARPAMNPYPQAG